MPDYCGSRTRSPWAMDFEIRTMGTDIARGIWVYHKGNTIIMLRVFIKKSQKTPAKEIDLAKKRLAEVLNETGKP